MSELRWNPLLRTYTIVAVNRQNRPHLDKGYCPFCPGSGKVPEHYDVHVYANDFPALSLEPDVPLNVQNSFHRAEKNYGKCEVILYSPDHHKSLSELSVEHIYKLVEIWTQRYAELSKNKNIQYIFEFENRGEEVGVTMHHPHGQLYAYPFVPLKIKTELENCKKYFSEKGSCLFGDMNKAEKQDGARLISENENFISYIPYFTDYPYGVFIVSKNKVSSFVEMNESEKRDFADMLKNITGAFDRLFNKPFPYMMCIYQSPVNSPEYADSKDYYRFHVEFYPPLRSGGKIKWMASSETGAWAAANTLLVEDTAKQLREALAEFRKNS